MNSGVPNAETLARWLSAAYQALEKNYLRELIFLVYLDPKKPEVIHEKFTFTFSYNEGIINMGLGKVSGTNKKEVKMEDLKGETQSLLRQIQMVTQGLEKLPDEAYLAIKLNYYDDVTPVDYEPEGFRPDHTKEEPMPEGSYRVDLGRVNTGFHAIRLKMGSRQQLSGAGYVNDSYAADSQSQSQSQQLSGETPVEDGGELSQSQSLMLEEKQQQPQDMEYQQDTQLSEGALSFSQPDSPASTVSLNVKEEPEPSSSPPAPEVSCVCQNTSWDPLMLVCSTCSTAQHASCYRLLSQEDLPAHHTCWTCSKENPGLTCTDPKMDKFTGKEDLIGPTCLFRRVLVLLVRSEGNTITTDFIQSALILTEEEVSSLKKRLLTQKVMTESSGSLVINREALKDALRLFMAVRSKPTSVTSASSNQRTSSKRKGENSTKGGEARGVSEPKKKKKSIAAADLRF